MSRWAASRYNVFVPLQTGGRLAYNSLSGAFAAWDAEDIATFSQACETGKAVAGDPRVRALISGGWLVNDDTRELEALETSYRSHRFDYRTLTLTIAPTLACDFACDYCFQGQDKPNETMSPEVQDAILGLVERVAPSLQRVHVAWYGGEPTLRMAIVESLSDRLIALCRGRGIQYDAMIVTNGYRLSADVARSLLSRQVKTAQVTLDGAGEWHDQRRVLISGKGTFVRITERLKEVVDSVALPIQVRVNIDQRNAHGIRRLIDQLSALGLAGRPTLKMYFAPVESLTEGCHSVSNATLGKQEYGRLETELHRYAYEKGLCDLPFPPRFRGTCAAVRPRGFVIGPNGDVHKCWDTISFPDRKVGTIFDLDALNHSPAVREWVDWSPFDNVSCRNCRILPICSGACAYKFLNPQSLRGEAAELPCPSWKYNLKEKLVLRAEKMGMISPADVSPQDALTRPEEVCVEPPRLPMPLQPRVPRLPILA